MPRVVACLLMFALALQAAGARNRDEAMTGPHLLVHVASVLHHHDGGGQVVFGVSHASERHMLDDHPTTSLGILPLAPSFNILLRVEIAPRSETVLRADRAIAPLIRPPIVAS